MGLVFNSRLWVLLSVLNRHPSHHYFSYFFCLLCIAYACMYGYITSIVSGRVLFFVITCERVGTMDWMCFPWQPPGPRHEGSAVPGRVEKCRSPTTTTTTFHIWWSLARFTCNLRTNVWKRLNQIIFSTALNFFKMCRQCKPRHDMLKHR